MTHEELCEKYKISTWYQGIRDKKPDWRAVSSGYCVAGSSKLLAEKLLILFIQNKDVLT